MKTPAVPLAAALLAATTSAAAIKVSVIHPGAADERVEGVVKVSGLGGVLVRVPLSPESRQATLDLPEGAESISAEVPGWWCDRMPVPAGASAGTVVQVSCWTAARIGGQVVPGGKRGEIEELTIRFQPAGTSAERRSGPSGSAVVPVRRGTWEAELPEGVLDVSLRARGLVPRYFFDLRTRSAKTLDLGRIELTQGASLVGSVDVSGGGRLKPEECLVTLRPDTEEAQGADSARASLAVRTVRPTTRGFFQFEGVPPGRWRLRASQPGMAEAARTVEIATDLEASLRQPLILGSFSSLDLRIEPRRAPEGGLWIVELLEVRDGAAPERVVETPLRGDGSWSYGRLVDGRSYLMRLKTSSGLGWWTDEKPFEMSAATRTRAIEVGVEKIRGSVLLGKRPIAAVLAFGEESHFPSIRMESDTSGRFEGVLPRRGAWRVGIRSAAPRVARSVDVEVPRPANAEVAEIEIRLPEGGFQGEIVDTKGKLVPNAFLRVRAMGWRETKSELIPDGSFLLEGLADGEYMVAADTRTAESESMKVTVTDGGVPEPLRLVLAPYSAIRGRTVIGPGVGLPRANVQRLPEPGAEWGRGMLRPAAMDGRWVVEIPASRSSACLIHAAPAYGTRISRMQPSPEEQEVLLQAAAGRLVLTAPKPARGEGRFPVLFHGGCMCYQLALRAYTRAAETEVKGGVRTEGLFEPGEYSLCVITHDEFSAFTGGTPSFQSCAHGVLLPGGQLELTAPDR